MRTALIIDDEPLARDIIREYLQKYNDIRLLAECGNGFDGLKAIKEHKPDVVFLDIQMPKITGFEMLELLETEHTPQIIFTTAFDEFAIKAFEANAVDYLLKPFNQQRFDKAMDKLLQEAQDNTVDRLKQTETTFLPQQTERVVIKTGNKIKIIPVYDIIYLESDDDYVNIYTQEGCFLKNKTMTFFENSLNATEFIRVHRSYIVKINEITKIEAYEKDSHVLILKSGVKIPVSKSRFGSLKAALGM